MKIILKQLELSNFKKLSGLWKFKDGKNVFLGKNRTGKTRLKQSEKWLRTGNGAPSIKAIIDGKITPKQNCSVIGIYNFDNKPVTLERIYKEKWAKKRGSLEAEFEGHKTAYGIDGSPVSKKIFDAKVYDIFGSEAFELTSDPTYFAGLKWQDRRRILTELAGDINTDKIIDSIAGFREILGDQGIQQRTDIAIQDKKVINEAMKQLPARIDELQRQIPEGPNGISIEATTVQIGKLKTDIELTKKKIDDFKSGSNSEVTKKLQILNEQLRKAISEFEADKNQAHKEFTFQSNRINQINNESERWKKEIVSFKEALANSRDSYKAIKLKEYEEKGNACNYCNEILVCHKCNEEDVKSQELFNKNRAEKLQSAIDNGRKFNGAIKKTEEIILIDLKKEKEDLEPLVKPEILSWSGNSLIDDLQSQIKRLDADKPDTEPPKELLEKLEQLEVELEKSLETLVIVRTQTESKKRIEELKGQRKKLSDEFDEVEKFLYLLDRYNKKLAEATEKPINEMFEYVRFKMFSTQINGSIIPACDIMSRDGRPYETALSGGEKIKAGLDIIKTMSEHFQMLSPVFIDNAESITDMPGLDTQTIELRASEEHEELTQL